MSRCLCARSKPEFNYPAGSDNVQNRYEGKGGIPISGFGMRLAAALAHTDRNILLTGYLTPREPDDDPPECAGARVEARRLHRMGHRSRIWSSPMKAGWSG